MAHFLFSNTTWLVVYLLSLAFVSGIVSDIDHPLHWALGLGQHARFSHGYLAVVGVVLICCGLGIIGSLHRRLF